MKVLEEEINVRTKPEMNWRCQMRLFRRRDSMI